MPQRQPCGPLSAPIIKRLSTCNTTVRQWQGEAEAGYGQTQQELARLEQVRLEQVRDLRRTEQAELREPDGILLRPCEARVLELEGVVPALVTCLSPEPFGAQPARWRGQSVEHGRATRCRQVVVHLGVDAGQDLTPWGRSGAAAKAGSSPAP